MLYSITPFIVVMSIIAWVRRRRLLEWNRFDIEFQLRPPGWGGSAWDKVLSVTLVLVILGALGMMGYVLAMPKVGEEFTEFYLLGLEGEAADYPNALAVGEEGNVVVGIINREHETVSYRFEVRVNGEKNNEVGPIILGHSKKWEGEVTLVFEVIGENQKVEFFLHKDGETEPCLKPLCLWVDVTE